MMLTVLPLDLLSKKVYAAESMKIGDYVQFGKYNDKPILWKIIDENTNGLLLCSDKIISFKPFDAAESGHYDQDSGNYKNQNEQLCQMKGSSRWKNSNIREWLNSDSQRVNYSTQPPTNEAIYKGWNDYDKEPGFLSNFTENEKGLINEVSNETDVFNWDTNKIDRKDITDDKVFLLTTDEINEYFKGYKYRQVEATKEAVIKAVEQGSIIYSGDDKTGAYSYSSKEVAEEVAIKVAQQCENIDYNNKPFKTSHQWSRTAGYDAYAVDDIYNHGLYYNAYHGQNGICPALYLKSANVSFKSGKGTVEEPYIPATDAVQKIELNVENKNPFSINSNTFKLADQKPFLVDGKEYYLLRNKIELQLENKKYSVNQIILYIDQYGEIITDKELIKKLETIRCAVYYNNIGSFKREEINKNIEYCNQMNKVIMDKLQSEQQISDAIGYITKTCLSVSKNNGVGIIEGKINKDILNEVKKKIKNDFYAKIIASSISPEQTTTDIGTENFKKSLELAVTHPNEIIGCYYMIDAISKYNEIPNVSTNVYVYENAKKVMTLFDSAEESQYIGGAFFSPVIDDMYKKSFLKTVGDAFKTSSQSVLGEVSSVFKLPEYLEVAKDYESASILIDSYKNTFYCSQSYNYIINTNSIRIEKNSNLIKMQLSGQNIENDKKNKVLNLQKTVIGTWAIDSEYTDGSNNAIITESTIDGYPYQVNFEESNPQNNILIIEVKDEGYTYKQSINIIDKNRVQMTNYKEIRKSYRESGFKGDGRCPYIRIK